jgi:uncharacterized protein (TIGR02466 family)
MSKAFDVNRAFWTPIVVHEVPEFSSINQELEKVILGRRAGGGGLTRSNMGGWESDNELLRWGGDAIRRIAQQAVDIADLNTVAQNPGDHYWQLEAWAVVLDQGASVKAHIHGGSYWSAVYFVRVDPGEGGELVLHDPRGATCQMHAPLLRFKAGGDDSSLSLVPKAGTMIIVPSWLSHSVNAWRGEGLRISVAINLAARSRSQSGPIVSQL